MNIQGVNCNWVAAKNLVESVAQVAIGVEEQLRCKYSKNAMHTLLIKLTRRRNLCTTVLAVVILLCATQSLLFAQDLELRCESLIQSCFAYSNQARSSCLFAQSRQKECAQSDAGLLAKRRAQLDLHALSAEGENMPTEPYSIDPECLRNFDHLWLSWLVNEEQPLESLEGLEDSLSSCIKRTRDDLLRP